MCDDHNAAQVITGLAEQVVDVDRCIVGLVAALNSGGFYTVASCCGHGHRPGTIALADGRELIIAPDYETARFIDKFFPVSAYGEVVEHEPYCGAESWHEEPYLCTKPQDHDGDHGCVYVDWPASDDRRGHSQEGTE